MPVFTFLFKGNGGATAVTFVYFLTNHGSWHVFAETDFQFGFVWFFKVPDSGAFYYFFVF